MGVTWAGKNESSRSASSRSAREQVGSAFRRVLSTTDRAVLFTNRSRPVELSAHAQVLASLRELHKVAAEECGGGLSAPSPAALMSGRRPSPRPSLLLAHERRPDARNEGGG